jgi:transcriptional regulator with XRE-family HTH domain
VDELHRRMARRVRERAKERKLPLSHLADRSGVSRAQLFDVLRGRKSPTLGWLNKIAHALDVDAGDLVAKGR